MRWKNGTDGAYGSTMYGTEGDDDDCKYHVKWTAASVAMNKDVTFTVVATTKADCKPVTLNFTWTPGAKPVLAGKASVKRLDFGVGEGEWADTSLIPNEIAVSTKVLFVPAK